MIRYFSIEEILEIHKDVIDEIGGSHGVLSQERLEASISQPQMSFSGQELYPDLPSKAAALAFFLTSNHAFNDGNKRTAYVAMRLLLILNLHDIKATEEESERAFLSLAAGTMEQDAFFEWVAAHTIPLFKGTNVED